MALGPWMLFLGMVLVLAGLPLYYATLRGSTRIALLLGHAALLQLLPSFLIAPYSIPLAPGLEVTPGNIFLVGLLLTMFLLVLVERRARVLRAAILVVLGVSLAEIALLATTSWAVSSPAFLRLGDPDPAVYGTLGRLVTVGNLLVIGELLLFVVVAQRLLAWGRRKVMRATLIVGTFAVVAVIDGIAFSAARNAMAATVFEPVLGGVGAKAFLAGVFGLPLFVFMLRHEESVRLRADAPLRVRDVLVPPPRRAVVERLEREHVALLERTLHVAEDERRRLSEDLHDDAIQLFTAAHIHLQRISASNAEVGLETAQELIRSGVGSLRRLILELRGTDVTASSFEPLVRSYVDRLVPEGQDTLEVEFDLDLSPDVPEEVAAGAYRIVLEALSNVVKHAEATRASVRVAMHDGHLVGEVVDDGVGIAEHAETGPGHLGLRAMRDRADVLGGQVDVHAVDRGTEVAFELPVQPAPTTPG